MSGARQDDHGGGQGPASSLPEPVPYRDSAPAHGIQVSIDWVRCNGLGICVALAPQVFFFDHDDEVATVHDAEAASSVALLEAARACPREAIFLDHADGRPLYP